MRTPIIALALLLAAPAAAQPRRIDDARVQDTLEALKLEPSIQQTQAAALQFFNIDPDTVSGMRTRAALKALLPVLEGSVRVNDSTVDSDTIDRQNFDDTIPALVGATGADVFEYGVSARWNLPQLVFNSEVLDVSSLAVLQEGVLKEVTRLYYTRRRLQVDLALNPADDAATRLSKELRIEELTATLDAMTGNLFSRQAARASRARPAPRRRR